MSQSYDYRVAGRVVCQLRLERGLSQEVLSGLAAMNRSHLAEIEGGAVNASVGTLWRIADALEIRPSELFRRVEEEIERRA